MFKIKNLSVQIGDKKVVENLTFQVGDGEVHAIMGPNGSGKSSLAMAIAGHPRYEVTEGEMFFDTVNVLELSPDERAKKGIFLAMQYPVAVPGLPVSSFLWNIYKLANVDTGSKIMKLGDFRLWLREEAEKLGLSLELLSRGLNDGFSGGEKKKLEILQMLVLQPKLIVLDEIDSGLDVDALKKIAQTVLEYAQREKVSVVAITHYSRLLSYLKPTYVHIVKDGHLVRSGGGELVDEIESSGYKLVDVA